MIAEGNGPEAPRSEPLPAGGTSDASRRAFHRSLGLAVALLAFHLYLNTLTHGYVLDDMSTIQSNRLTTRGVAGIPEILTTSYRYGYWGRSGLLYRPLSLVMFAVEWQFFPGRAAVGHLVNIVLYGLLGWVLFGVLRKLMAGVNVVYPFVIALLFVAHPVHTEVVANIKSRDEILCFLFLLLALRLYLTHLQTGSVRTMLLSLLCYFLALQSKESAITFLAVFPLAVHFFTRTPARRNLLRSALFAAPTLIYVAIRVAVLGSLIPARKFPVIENVLVAAPDAAGRIATAILLLGKYLLILVFPYPLACDYSYNQIPITDFSDPRVLLALVVFAFATVLAVLHFRKRNAVAFAILYSLATVTVFSNLLFLIGTSFAERLLFAPSLGFCIAVGVLLGGAFGERPARTEGAKSWGELLRSNRRLLSAVAVVLAVYSLLTFTRNLDWRSPLSLYTADVKKSPGSARIHYYLGVQLMLAGAEEDNTADRISRFDAAVRELEAAIEIYPRYAVAYDQIGHAWHQKGDLEQAIRYYGVALHIDPTLDVTYFKLAAIHYDRSEFEQALRLFLEAVKYDPFHSAAWLNLGSTYVALGKPDDAIEAYLRCLEIEPDNAMAHRLLGITYWDKGEVEKGRFHLDRARRLEPNLPP